MQPKETVSIPEFTLGDRLRKARDHADLSQHDLAREIGIARSSIVNYETDRKVPNRPVVLSWAIRCQVSPEWLMTGQHDEGFRTAPTSIPAASKVDVRQLGARDAREQSRRALRNFPTAAAI